MATVDDLLDALDRVGSQPGRPVSAHLDPALNAAAKVAVSLGLADSVSGLTEDALRVQLRRLALRAALDAHYAERPSDRPSVVDVALFLATVRKLPAADHPALRGVLTELAEAMGEADPDTLLAAAVGHLAITGSAA